MPEPMRRSLARRARRCALPLLLLGLAGCVDSLGLGSGCTADMALVRRQEGGGPDSSSGPQELNGNYTEHWTYRSARRTYTFRWGASYAGCEVDGPRSFIRVPGDLFQY